MRDDPRIAPIAQIACVLDYAEYVEVPRS